MALWKLLRGRLDKARRPRSYRPRLEALETRELLSVCTVDRLTDNNPSSGDGGNGRGDLRWCVVESLFRADSINIAATGTINLNARLPTLTRNISIEGAGANLITVRRSTGGDYGIFTVATGATANFSGLTISNGDVSGISNSGTLAISNSTITGNLTNISYGGGIYNGGTLTVSNSIIAGNSAGAGGGICNSKGTLTISNSTITGNSASTGGGVYNDSGMVTVSRSTITGNSAGSGAGGGGIYNVGRSTGGR